MTYTPNMRVREMADPTKYQPSYSFTDFQTGSPTQPLPAPQVDNELANVATSVNATVDALKDVRRSDGALKNAIVTPDSLSAATRSLIANLGEPRGAWAPTTAYAIKDFVSFEGATYAAVSAHTSSAAFSTDLDAGLWLLIASPYSISGAVFSQVFDGDGVTTAFALSQPFNSIEELAVYVQDGSAGYERLRSSGASPQVSLVGTTQLTFSAAPGAGTRNIFVEAINQTAAESAAVAAVLRDEATALAAATAADRVQTGLDVVATNADALATAADRVQTGLDAASAAASAADAAASAATLPAVSSLAYVRGNVGGAAFETRTPGQVPTDLTVTQTGTGAVARALSSKVLEIVSVKDFGATGDGVVDDTAAVQAAITAWAADGGTLVFPPGTYKLTATVTAGIPTDTTPRDIIAYGAIIQWSGASGYAIHLHRTGTTGGQGVVTFRGGNYIADDLYVGPSSGYGIFRFDDATAVEWLDVSGRCIRGNIWNIRNVLAWSENTHWINCSATAYCIIRYDHAGGTNSAARQLIRDMYVGSIYGPYGIYRSGDIGVYDSRIENIKGNVGNLALAFVVGLEYGSTFDDLSVENHLAASAGTYAGTYVAATRTLTLTTADAVFVAGRDDPETSANQHGITFDKGSRTETMGRIVRFTDSGGTVRFARVQAVTGGQTVVLHPNAAIDGAVTAAMRYGFVGVEMRATANNPTVLNASFDSLDASPWGSGNSVSFQHNCWNGYSSNVGYKLAPDQFKQPGGGTVAWLGRPSYGFTVNNRDKATHVNWSDAWFGNGHDGSVSEARVNLNCMSGDSKYWQLKAYGGVSYANHGKLGFFVNNSNSTVSERAYLDENNFGHRNLLPMADNTYDSGAASYRIKQYYGVNTTISTSDERQKTGIAAPDDALLDAVDAIGLVLYQWIDRVAEKGADARIHAGAIAQQVEAVFRARGLDPARYALWCADPLTERIEALTEVERDFPVYQKDDVGNPVVGPDGEFVVVGTERKMVTVTTTEDRPVLGEDGEQVVRYGLRYDHLAVLLAAAARRRMSRIEARLTALEVV